MTETKVKERLQKEAARLNSKYGLKTGALGSESFHLNVVPTGILSLDYALGTGGWPLGFVVEVFGPPDIGKSSVVGFDKEWAVKNGVDPEMLVVARPDTGDDAFAILHDWVTDDLVDFIVFDSIGAVLKAAETAAEGKPMQGGQSNLITWGIKRILTPTWKNNKGVMLLNQIRADMASRIPNQVESPGGNALKHSCSIRVQLRPGRERHEIAVGTGEDRHKILTGRQMIAVVKRNKHTEGTNARALFHFYQMDTEDKTIGIDISEDVISTSLKTNVIQKSGAYYSHSAFPDGKIHSKEAVKEYLAENPELVTQLRSEVLQTMTENVLDHPRFDRALATADE
jgi:recombination protein RecA